MIYHITPFCTGNIGKGINEMISLLPDDAWICLRDQDTLLFDGSGELIEQIVANNSDYSLIGCKTNRLGTKGQLIPNMYDNDSITAHRQTFLDLFSFVVSPVSHVLAGVFMLFPKSVWEKVGGFKEKSIHFDIEFTNAVRKKGGKVGIAQGLYVLHMYRWGKPDARNYTKHLKNCK